MKFQFNITTNNITYTDGDALLVDFSTPLTFIDSINFIDFDFNHTENVLDFHDISIRWSFDTALIDRASGSLHTVWSAWMDYKKDLNIIQPTIDECNLACKKQNKILLQFRITRKQQLNKVAVSLNTIIIDYIQSKGIELVSEDPMKGMLAKSCPSSNFSGGILIKCDPSLLFRPYDIMNPAIRLFQEMSVAVSEMFGHNVRYFKTQAKIESADVIFKEYSLYNVTDVKDIKVLVPDNAFPDNAIRFLPYDMDFGEGLEIHIVREHFERAFGDDLPEQKDFLYFPAIDRFFEVQSAYLFRDFMADNSYYKVMLYKWQDKLNVIRDNPDIDDWVNEMHESLDDLLGDEMKVEYQKATKPLQYKTISVGDFDHVRSHINENLLIESKDLSNYFTIISKYFYNLNSNMKLDDLAIQYKLAVNRNDIENTAISFWINNIKTIEPNTRTVLIDGYDDIESKGIKISLVYVPSLQIEVLINNDIHTFDNIPALPKGEWFGFVFNVMNEFSQLDLHIWKINDIIKKSTKLQLYYNKLIKIVPQEIKPATTMWSLRAGTINMTNLRIWSQSIEEEKQPLLLNQYIVKDNQYSLLIDNMIPPLRLSKEFVR